MTAAKRAAPALPRQILFTDEAFPVVKLVVTIRTAKCLVMIVGRNSELGPTAQIAAVNAFGLSDNH